MNSLNYEEFFFSFQKDSREKFAKQTNVIVACYMSWNFC